MTPSADDRFLDYLYLCRRGAHKFLRAGLERGDLEQVAAIGLLKAVRRYQPDSGTPFEAFAWILVLGELQHFVRDHERSVRVPRRIRELERRYDRTKQMLFVALGREPREDEMGSALGVSVEALTELTFAKAAAVASPLSEAIAVGRRVRDTFEEQALLTITIDSLADLERRVLMGLYIAGLTQLELSRRLGVPRKAIARAHRAALANMQRAWVA